MNKITERKIFLTLSISISLSCLLFLSSLTQNAYYINSEQKSVASYFALLLGIFALKGAGIAWLANPCLCMSFIHLKRTNLKKAKIFSVISVLFGLSFMLFDKVIANEAGGKAEITAYDLGYWLWLSSLIINLIGILVTDIFVKKDQTQ